MKRKALVVALLCFMGLATLSIGNAVAAPANYTCTIAQTGSDVWGYYWVTLSDTASTPTFTNTPFFIVDRGTGTNKAMYAAALTAWANTGRVYVYADLALTACYSLMTIN